MTPLGPLGDDRERLTRWVQDHAAPVRGFLLALVRQQDLADDLLQETFRRAWQARERYVEAGRERSYLLRIADRLVVDYSRRGQRKETTVDENVWHSAEPPDRQLSAERRLAQAEAAERLKEALQVLSEPQRRVLLMRFFGDLEFSEIANAMQCPLSTVLSHCHRGLAKLRKTLTSGSLADLIS